ncbi:nucleotidyltransferase domain-containing protein [Oscillatoria amoena NRMC-F 0135]|nr:nucleotidyltransferase domain-containing protein [Oscillatoria laete-virens]MDL5046547.1 nucleotidyltransferase domain-containing protein [Oscillatoria amoena NRMC-F 0135]MDL5054837.1 nucleotidyltransferase domain-containing protein [Oscillatoria laete-virens NRMC-F 0139]
MIDLPPRQLAVVRRLLATHVPECEVRAFGSRVTGKAKPYSDLDIALLGPTRLSINRLAALREAFQESDLPIRVDVIDWEGISENFRAIIAGNFELLQKPVLTDAESAKPESAIRANLKGLGLQ